MGGAGGAQAGSGGAGTAGSGGMPGPDEDACGVIPMGPPEKATEGRTDEYGTLEYDVRPPNELIALRTKLLVPEEPPPRGVIFLWPGIQPLPSSANFSPIGNGVLQPVLTWGQSCVPGALPGHDTWWISPVYVNISARDPAYRGCKGGPVIRVEPETWLEIDMRLEGTEWTQVVYDPNTDEKTEFTIDLKAQGQARALFIIELPNTAKPTEDIVFASSVFSMKEPQPSACDVLRHGPTDYSSKARVSADGKHCCIDRIVLRAQGVPATTTDP
jgi:hypothetical protein